MTLSLPKTLLAVGFAAIAAIAVPEGTMTTPASAQSMGWTPFDQLAGAGEYGRVARQSRRIGGGGSLRDIRFDDGGVYFASGPSWVQVDLESGERTTTQSPSARSKREKCGAM